MRRVEMGVGLALLVFASGAGAQGLQVPPTSRAESQTNALNRSMAVEQQNRASAQQNQFEVNSLRNELSRPAPPPLIPYNATTPGIGR
ncbi:hypothetical protein [uncultured Enterovirga sp.]|uniref:hypothetical protein n=1 Tax=uncultured Enterovirga sp. TaxID=2026352 RepID=UPI0035C9C31B